MFYFGVEMHKKRSKTVALCHVEEKMKISGLPDRAQLRIAGKMRVASMMISALEVEIKDLALDEDTEWIREAAVSFGRKADTIRSSMVCLLERGIEVEVPSELQCEDG